MSLERFTGKKIRAEYRIGRRTHHISIGTLRVGSCGLEAVFPYHSLAGERAFVFPLSEQQLKRLLPVQRPDCDYQFSGLLDAEGLSEDDGAWTRPPKIVTIDGTSNA